MKRQKMFMLVAILLLLLTAVQIVTAQSTIEVGSLVVVVGPSPDSIDKIDLLQSEGGPQFSPSLVVYPDDTGFVVAVSGGWVKIDPDAVQGNATGWLPVDSVRLVESVEDLVSFGRVVDAILALYRIPPSTEAMSYEVSRCPEEPYCVRIDGLASLVNPFADQWVDGFTLYPREAGQVRPGFEGNPDQLHISIPPSSMLSGRVIVTAATLRFVPSELMAPSVDAYTEAIARSQFGIPENVPNLRAVWSGTHTWFFYLEETGAPTDATQFTVNNVCDEWVDGVRVTPGDVRPDYSDINDSSVISIPPTVQSIAVVAITARPCANDQLNTYGFSWALPEITALAG